jgi:hypothetical protein
MDAHCAPCPVNTPSNLGYLTCDCTPIATFWDLAVSNFCSILEHKLSVFCPENATLTWNLDLRCCSVQPRFLRFVVGFALRYVEYALTIAMSDRSDFAEKTKGVVARVPDSSNRSI